MRSVIIPVYNEELAAKDIIMRTHRMLNADDEVVVVNDGSTDGTPEVLRTINEPNIKIVSHESNQGNGASIVTGAKNASGEWIAIIDADKTYYPEDIPLLFDHAQKHELEMVTGVRGTLNMGPFSHRLAREILRRWCEILSHSSIEDINSGLRILTKKRLLRYEHIYPRRFSLHIVLSVCCGKENVPFGFVPIRYGTRIGSSKLSPGMLGIGNFIKFLFLAPYAALKVRKLKNK